jgi:hypothetical protein
MDVVDHRLTEEVSITCVMTLQMENRAKLTGYIP